MLLELRLFSLLDLLLNAPQRLGCPRVGLGSVAQPGVDLVGVVCLEEFSQFAQVCILRLLSFQV